MDISQSIQQRFGPAAAAYGESAVHRAGADLDAMLASAGLAGDERVLDLGCGAGHTAFAFAEHCREVVAYDLTPAMLEQAREELGADPFEQPQEPSERDEDAPLVFAY